MKADAQKSISRSNMLLALTAVLLASTALSAPSQAGVYIAQPQSNMFASRLHVNAYQPVTLNRAAYTANSMNMRVLPVGYNALMTRPPRNMPATTYHTPGLMPTGMNAVGRAPFQAGPVYHYTSQRRRIGYGPSATSSAPRQAAYMQPASYQGHYQPTYNAVSGNAAIVPTFMGSSFSQPTYQQHGYGSATQQLHTRWISPMQHMVPHAAYSRNSYLRPASMSTPVGQNTLLPPPAVAPRSQLNIVPPAYAGRNILMPAGNPSLPTGMSYGVPFGPVIISSKTIGKTIPASPYQQLPYGGGPLIINSSNVPVAPSQPKRRKTHSTTNTQATTRKSATTSKSVNAKQSTSKSAKVPTGTKQASNTPSKLITLEKSEQKPVAAPPASKTVAPPASTPVSSTPAAPAPAKVDPTPKQPAPIAKPTTSNSVLGTAPFESDSAELSSQAKQSLDTITVPLKEDENKRIQLLAYAKENSDDTSRARRLSLSRALSVRSYLIEKGIQSTRIDVRALGSKTDQKPEDRVDIVALP